MRRILRFRILRLILRDIPANLREVRSSREQDACHGILLLFIPGCALSRQPSLRKRPGAGKKGWFTTCINLFSLLNGYDL